MTSSRISFEQATTQAGDALASYLRIEERKLEATG
jgi:hypothetical protein